MAAYDTTDPAPSSGPTSWFHDFQIESGWGTTPNMATQTTYYLRAYDSGTAGYVYWSNTGTEPDLSPGTTDTTPNYSGSLTVKAVINSAVL